MFPISNAPMPKQPGEQLMSGGVLFNKFIFPIFYFLFFGFLMLFFPFAVKQFSFHETICYACFGLLMLGCGLHRFTIYHFQLKKVWLSSTGLRVSSFKNEINIPFESIAGVTQPAIYNVDRFIIVTLNKETSFGRRVIFLPKNPKVVWGQPFSWEEDDVVIKLRERIEAAHQGGIGKKSREPIGRPTRSIMADGELDGPF